MKYALTTLFAAALAATLATASAAQTVIRVASFTPEGAVGVRFVMKPWMEAVQKELGNKVQLLPFWGGALGPNAFEQFDLVRTGVVDVAWVLPGYTPGQFPQVGATELPFTVASGEEGSVVLWRLVQTGLVDGLEDVHVLTAWTPDITNIHLMKPVQGLGELKGMALRTAGPTQAMLVEALGAAPQTLDSGEANEAMKRGTIGGQLQGWTGMNTFGGFAVAKAAYRVPIGASPFFMLMNKKVWNSLPADVQAVMMKHGGEALARAGGAAYDRITNDIVAKQTTAGYQVVMASEAEVAAYQKAYGSIFDKWVAATPKGRETLDTYLRLIGEVRAGK